MIVGSKLLALLAGIFAVVLGGATVLLSQGSPQPERVSLSQAGTSLNTQGDRVQAVADGLDGSDGSNDDSPGGDDGDNDNLDDAAKEDDDDVLGVDDDDDDDDDDDGQTNNRGRSDQHRGRHGE